LLTDFTFSCCIHMRVTKHRFCHSSQTTVASSTGKHDVRACPTASLPSGKVRMQNRIR
jgi:hypothetical protein